MRFTVGALSHRGVVVLVAGDGAEAGVMTAEGDLEGTMIGVREEIVSLRWELRRCIN